MPRRRFIKIVSITAVLIACGITASIVLERKPPEAYYQGRSSSSWLHEFFGANGKQVAIGTAYTSCVFYDGDLCF